jgi:hypothetical protein
MFAIRSFHIFFLISFWNENLIELGEIDNWPKWGSYMCCWQLGVTTAKNKIILQARKKLDHKEMYIDE